MASVYDSGDKNHRGISVAREKMEFWNEGIIIACTRCSWKGRSFFLLCPRTEVVFLSREVLREQLASDRELLAAARKGIVEHSDWLHDFFGRGNITENDV